MSTFGPNDFIWTGIDHLQAVLFNVSPRVTEFLGGTMMDVMDKVFQDSQAQVPVDTGALRSSGYVDEPDISPGDISVSIGYGARYAIYVHEVPMNHPHGGKMHFLSDPMKDALNDLQSRMQGRFEAVIIGQGAGGSGEPEGGGGYTQSKSRTKSGSRTSGRHSAQRRAPSAEHGYQSLRANKSMNMYRSAAHDHSDVSVRRLEHVEVHRNTRSRRIRWV